MQKHPLEILSKSYQPPMRNICKCPTTLCLRRPSKSSCYDTSSIKLPHVDKVLSFNESNLPQVWFSLLVTYNYFFPDCWRRDAQLSFGPQQGTENELFAFALQSSWASRFTRLYIFPTSLEKFKIFIGAVYFISLWPFICLTGYLRFIDSCGCHR